MNSFKDAPVSSSLIEGGGVGHYPVDYPRDTVAGSIFHEDWDKQFLGPSRRSGGADRGQALGLPGHIGGGG